jgi:hypothetical protein
MANPLRFRTCIALVLAILLQAINAPAAFAHALGVDPAELVELPGGSYRLTSKVPQSLAHFITAPELPEQCTLDGSPRGERGPYEVRYTFTCKAPLTAQDTLFLPWGREGVMLTVTWADGSTATRFVAREGETIDIDLAYFQAGSGSWLEAAQRYTVLGVEHILLGIDHLLFVLALLLIVRGPWMLVKTVTAFTVAHSITLALATLGFINVPSRPVEAAIALSIVFCVSKSFTHDKGVSVLPYATPGSWPSHSASCTGLDSPALSPRSGCRNQKSRSRCCSSILASR